MRPATSARLAGCIVALSLTAAACGTTLATDALHRPAPGATPNVRTRVRYRRRRSERDPAALTGIHKIRHVVVIMQENRSFDSYFGTFPGADGIPMRNGVPTVCVPDSNLRRCIRPFHDHHVVNAGGPHSTPAFNGDFGGGAMTGFIREALAGEHTFCATDTFNPLSTAV